MNPNESKKRRRHYDTAYKQHAVELVQRGDRGICEVARELGINVGMLARWRKEMGLSRPTVSFDPPPKTPLDKDREIERLKAELERMKEREYILKESLGILSAPPRDMPRSRR